MTMRCDDLATAGTFLVHSPVRWDAACERPQEIFSRLARTCDVLYVETPLFLDDVARPALDRSEPVPGVLRLVPRLPAMYAALEHATQVIVQALLNDLLGAFAERTIVCAHWSGDDDRMLPNDIGVPGGFCHAPR